MANQIVGFMRNFLWSGMEEKMRDYLVSWEVL